MLKKWLVVLFILLSVSVNNAVEMKIKKLEEGKVSQLINSLKDLAKVDKNVADVLKQYNFL